MKKNVTTYKRIAFGLALLGSTIIGSSVFGGTDGVNDSCLSSADCQQGLQCLAGVCSFYKASHINSSSSGRAVPSLGAE